MHSRYPGTEGQCFLWIVYYTVGPETRSAAVPNTTPPNLKFLPVLLYRRDTAKSSGKRHPPGTKCTRLRAFAFDFAVTY
eukprot:2684868-Rhodomonas_salina.2